MPTPSYDQDAEVEAATREILGHLHDALLREGADPDAALDEVAGLHRERRAEWEAAKREDANAKTGH
jgi:hypothetical protein